MKVTRTPEGFNISLTLGESQALVGELGGCSARSKDGVKSVKIFQLYRALVASLNLCLRKNGHDAIDVAD